MDTVRSDVPILEVNHLSVLFPHGKSLFLRPHDYVHAVDDVSFSIRKEEILGIAGESGSGKTTIGNVIVKLVKPSSASSSVKFEGHDIFSQDSGNAKTYRKDVQMIFQDPYDSLNPRSRVIDIVSQPLLAQGLVHNKAERLLLVSETLAAVDLSVDETLYKLPHQLSGGQRQRVAIARAIVTKPKLVIADEPVSMLDVSLRSEVLNLILDLRRDFGITWVFISHDLAVTKYVSDLLMIMYLGRIMELGPPEDIVANPLHPYTQLLLVTVPSIDGALSESQQEVVVKGEIPSGLNPPPGCRFASRCPYVLDKCRATEPPLVEVKRGHYVACHLVSREAIQPTAASSS
jgi:oligopeptide/dipeptide ABC transporter ATP-binding protein